MYYADVADVGSEITNESHLSLPRSRMASHNLADQTPLISPRSSVTIPHLYIQPVGDAMDIHQYIGNNSPGTTATHEH